MALEKNEIVYSPAFLHHGAKRALDFAIVANVNQPIADAAISLQLTRRAAARKHGDLVASRREVRGNLAADPARAADNNRVHRPKQGASLATGLLRLRAELDTTSLRRYRRDPESMAPVGCL